MSRSHEARIVIDAPIEEVWAALTEPEQMARWFAPKVTVEPGAGGRIVSHRGPGLDWPTIVEAWEPGRHLRLAENRDRMISPIERKLSPCRLVQDFYLERDAGRTALRFVHAGFGDDGDWDLEYDGARAGWFGRFYRLQQTIERHRGEAVHNGIETVLIRGVLWQDVLAKFEALPQPEKEIVYRKPYHLGALLPAHNGSILTLSTQPADGGTLLFFEYLFFNQPLATVASLVGAIRTALVRG